MDDDRSELASVLRRVRTRWRLFALLRTWGAASTIAGMILALALMTSMFAYSDGSLTVLLWAVALTGEAVADRQLARFKARPSSRGRTCREGLWRYSRHPNYFFEWLVWVAYALFALASPYGALALICPVVMLYLLFRVTGIPATEAQALRSKGDDYRRYQATTSVFVPWFPRSAS